jgi:hypothetical protein
MKSLQPKHKVTYLRTQHCRVDENRLVDYLAMSEAPGVEFIKSHGGSLLFSRHNMATKV